MMPARPCQMRVLQTTPEADASGHSELVGSRDQADAKFGSKPGKKRTTHSCPAAQFRPLSISALPDETPDSVVSCKGRHFAA